MNTKNSKYNHEIRFDDIPCELEKTLDEISNKTRLWFYQRSEIASTIDYVDDRVHENMSHSPSLWYQLTLLVYKTLELTNHEIVREAWLSIGEFRQALRQAVKDDPLVDSKIEDNFFKEKFTDLINYILDELTINTIKLS